MSVYYLTSHSLTIVKDVTKNKILKKSPITTKQIPE